MSSSVGPTELCPTAAQQRSRMEPLQLDDPIEAVPGVGEARAAALRRARIGTVEDLLLHLPARYEDRSRQVPIGSLREGEAACVLGEVRSCRRVPGPRRRTRVEVQLEDASGTVTAIWFNQPYLADRFQRGARLLLYGRPTCYRDRVQLVNPVHAVVGSEPDGEDSLHIGRLVPVYRRVGPLGPALLRRLVATALELLGPIEDSLPKAARAATGLLDRCIALRQVHMPASGSDLQRYGAGRSAAHRRLVLEEFIAFQTALAMQRQQARQEPGIRRQVSEQLRQKVIATLPFELTGAQHGCLREIFADLEAPRAMHRLLQGDVGSGKTAVAACAMLVVALGGEQVALLAPTGILAEQQTRTLTPWARALGLGVELLTGATPRPQRRDILARLKRGGSRILVGTHALLEPAVRFDRLGLVVIDEQHRFGVGQRAALRAKGREGTRHPDLLVMTATPIPRSLALTLYGDLEVSTIDQMPPGRTPVATRVFSARKWPALLDALGRALDEGQQAFVVSPRIEEAEGSLSSATQIWDELSERFPGVQIALLHGGLDATAKSHAMHRFVSGRARVLVATSVIEVGVDVPAATLMIIHNAERFGLAQLHQLRGRVGRGGGDAHCWLVAHEPQTAAARARLQTLRRTADGFRIAEEDLRLRGPGEVLGTQQAGSFGLRVGDPFAHPDWLLEAREIAGRIVASREPDAVAYRDALRRSWKTRMELARAG